MNQWLYCPSDGHRFKSPEERLCPVCCRMRGSFKEADLDAHRKPWRRVLYLKQDFPDNYTDSSFLEKLQMNKNARRYSYCSLVVGSGAITQHLSGVALFAAAFYHTDAGACMWIFSLSLPEMQHAPSAQALKGCFLLVFLLLGVSPILKTLTDTVSTDSIYAMAAGMLLVNLFTHDYTTGLGHHLLSGMNEAMFAAVCLASRLPTSLHGFGLLLLALEIFIALPYVCRCYRKRFPASQIRMTAAHVAIATAGLATVGKTPTTLFVFTVVCVTFVGPLWLLSVQKYKRTIRGPWDEAVVKAIE